MRIALLADIHSNMEALNAVLKICEEQKVNKFILLGDIIGYGPHPNEVIQKLKKINILGAVWGDHDLAYLKKLELNHLNLFAIHTILLARKVILKENHSFLNQLTHTFLLDEKYFFLHSFPLISKQYRYSDTIEEMKLAFLETNFSFNFIAHNHKSFTAIQDDKNRISFTNQKKIKLNNQKIIASIGSIGQPKGNSYQAQFSILDTNNNSLEFFRTAYNYTKTQKDMKILGAPDFLINKLAPINRD